MSAPSNGTTVSGTTVSVSANASDNVGVAGVQFVLDTTNLGSEDTTSPYSIVWNTTTATNGSHTLKAVARDAAGNAATSSTITVTVNNPVPDTTAPSVPSGLSATAVSSSQINLSWSASTDNVSVTGYRVERCQGSSCTTFTQISTPAGTTYSNTGLAANTTYRYRVRAADAAGNLSGYSSIVNGTTQSAPTGGYTRVFFDNFESGNTNLWQQEDYRNKCSVVSSAADNVVGPYDGTKMARCNWNGTVAWNDAAAVEIMGINSINYTNEVFIRARIRLDQNLDHTSGSAAKVMRFVSDAQGVNDMYNVIYTSNSMRNEGIAWGTQMTTYWGSAPDNTASSDVWHQLEYYMNNSTGVIKVWHDELLIRNTTFTPNSTPWYPLYLTSNWSDPHDATNYAYFDSVEVYTDSTSGTAATGNLSDASIRSGQ